MLYMKTAFIITAALLTACSDGSTRKSTMLSSSSPLSDTEATLEASRDVPISTKEILDDGLIVRTVSQLYYVNPSSLDDIIDEVSIIIEAETGERVDMSEVKSCYKTFSKNEEVTSYKVESVFAYLRDRSMNEEDVNLSMNKAGQVIDACEQSDKVCPGYCDIYGAISLVITSPSNYSEQTLNQ